MRSIGKNRIRSVHKWEHSAVWVLSGEGGGVRDVRSEDNKSIR